MISLDRDKATNAGIERMTIQVASLEGYDLKHGSMEVMTALNILDGQGQ